MLLVRKSISVSLVFIILISVIVIPVNASDDSLDLSEYTLDDLKNMSPEEFYELCEEFDRIYDPFGTYEERHSTTPVELGGYSIVPCWVSGEDDNDGYEFASHSYITMQAMAALSNDKTLWMDDALDALVTVLVISMASDLPDKEEIDFPFLFAGHFYNPITGKSYTGLSSKTAKTRAEQHYNAAVSAADTDFETMYLEIGECLHYYQDICVPHHTALDTVGIFSSHSMFEEYADGNIEEFINPMDSVLDSLYTFTNNNSISTSISEYALYSYYLHSYVDDKNDQSDWEWVAQGVHD